MPVPLVAVPNLVTLSGGVWTDVERTAALQGDGLPIGSGVGIYEAYAATECSNPNAATDLTGWTRFNATETLARDTTFAFFGSTSFKVTTSGTAGDGYYYNQTGLVAGTVKSARILFKGTAGRSYRFETVSGATVQFGIFTATGQTQILTATATVAAGATNIAWCVLCNHSVAGDVYWFGGLQINTGAVPFPFSTSARAAGRVSLPSSLVSGVQGWILARTLLAWSSTTPAPSYTTAVEAGDGTTNNRVTLYWNAGFWRILTTASGVSVEANRAEAFAAMLTRTAIGEWSASSVGVSVAGVKGTPLARSGAFAVSQIAVGTGSGGGYNFIDGTVAFLAFGTGTLSTADHAAMGTAADPYALAAVIPASAGLTAIWPGKDAALWLPAASALGPIDGALRVRSRYAGALEVADA